MKRFVAILFVLLMGAGCAEKKSRIWIDPPVGIEVTERNPQKIYYQIEDMQSGKKESLTIPLQQMPENLVVEQKNKPAPESELALATRADKQISAGQILSAGATTTPTLSYLHGLAEVESMYQKKQYAEALVRIAPLLEEYPKQSRLFVMQGTLFRRIGEKKLALASYKRAQQLEPNNPTLEEAVLKAQDETGENL